MTSHWTKNLNPEQAEAATHVEGPLLILAGAGSGKTTVLVSRTGQLIEAGAAQASEILVLTFTNKSARELKERVAHKLGDKAKGLWAGTFHSFGLQILKANGEKMGLPKGFGVLDQNDSRQVIKDILRNTKVSTKEGFDPDKCLEIINRLRTGDNPEGLEHEDYLDVARVLGPRYEKRLETLGVVDFEGLLLKPLELFEKFPEVLEKYQKRYRFLMVDEFQDTNALQMRLLDAISANHRNLAVVGDDDQSIYGWRGAEVRNILDFPKRYKPCRVVKLERNYRSHSSIIDVANEIIKKNQDRHTKVLKAEFSSQRGRKPEVFVFDSDEQEVEEVVSQLNYFTRQGYAWPDMAVLYRSNSQGALLEGALRRSQIPYEVTGGSELFERSEIKDCLSYLRCSIVPHEVAYRRILNTPSRGIGDTTVEVIAAHAKAHNMSFFMAAKSWKEAGVHDRAGEAIDKLGKTLSELPALLTGPSDVSVTDRWVKFCDDLGYRDHVYQQFKDPQAAKNRWQLIEIFGRILEGFVKRNPSPSVLKDFLEIMELRDKDTDSERPPAVQLLTLHASKGLEFPVVVLMGVEEDLLPHRSLGGNVDEERRLFYVGVTRAKERLVLTHARTRKKYGRLKPSVPSRFLLELPQDLFETYQSGLRPVSETEKKSLLSDFYNKKKSE